MREHKTPADRLGAPSDAVVAVITTIMVLELKAPQSPRFSALPDRWPTAVSYAVSFLFIAIIWVNHHYLLRFVAHVTPRLIWVNFAHLFGVPLVPFATAWIARAQVAAAPVAVYAAIFAGANLASRMFEKEVLAQATSSQPGQRTRRTARRRSLATLLIFVTASLVSLEVPLLGLALICNALVLYLRPEPSGSLLYIPRMS
jgi:uncharacterized membrane protein